MKWRDAHASDADELREFICTDPPARDANGCLDIDAEAFAELEAQTGIRDGIQFPLPRGEHVLLGVDDQGIAAVAWWCEIGGVARLKLLVMAVARRCRRTEVHLGDQLLEEVLSRMLEAVDPRFDRCVAAHALVRPANAASQALLHRQQFFYVQDNGEFQEWWVRMDVPD